MAQNFPVDPPIPLDPNTVEGAMILGCVSQHRDLYVFPDQTTPFDADMPEDDELDGDDETQKAKKKSTVEPRSSPAPVSLVYFIGLFSYDAN